MLPYATALYQQRLKNLETMKESFTKREFGEVQIAILKQAFTDAEMKVPKNFYDLLYKVIMEMKNSK